MNNSCVSLIVPVYNAVKYLSRCVDSILNQNYTDFELILVNDGSTDGSLAICEDFERRDSRVFVINEDNQGVSSARNHGIKVAKGDYICFVDADDYVSPSYLDQLVSPALLNDRIDLVLQGRIKCEREKQILVAPDRDDVYYLSKDSVFFDDVSLFRFCAVFSKLFKRNIIQNHEISFSKTLNHGEDFDFLANYLLYCDGVQVSTCANYYYMINPGSLSDRFNTFELKHEGLNYLFNSLSNLNQKHGKPMALEKQISDYVASSVAGLLSLVYEYPKAEKAVRIEKIKSIETCFVQAYRRCYLASSLNGKILKCLFVNKLYCLFDLVNLFIRFSREHIK